MLGDWNNHSAPGRTRQIQSGNGTQSKEKADQFTAGPADRKYI